MKYLIVLILFFMSCTSKDIKTEYSYAKIAGNSINVYVIDGCEYIGNFERNNPFLTHKGNCKQCSNKTK